MNIANLPEAPVDPFILFPLPFVPDANLPPMPAWGDWDYNRYIANFHHPNFKHWELEHMGLGGKAARDSRIQWSWWWQHHVFHSIWGGLDEHMPRTEADQLWTTLCGTMDYVPEQAISFSGDLHIVDINQAERALVRQQTLVGNNGVRTSRFLLDLSFREGAPQVEPRVVRKFLHLANRPSTSPERLLNLAETLIQQAIDPVLQPRFQERYDHMRAMQLVRPGLPRRLGSLIRREIGKNFASPQDQVSQLVARWRALAPSMRMAER